MEIVNDTPLSRLTAAIKEDADTVDVISSDVNEICRLCDPNDTIVAELKKKHPRGTRELHSMATSDLKHLVGLADK